MSTNNNSTLKPRTTSGTNNTCLFNSVFRNKFETIGSTQFIKDKHAEDHLNKVRRFIKERFVKL